MVVWQGAAGQQQVARAGKGGTGQAGGPTCLSPCPPGLAWWQNQGKVCVNGYYMHLHKGV